MSSLVCFPRPNHQPFQSSLGAQGAQSFSGYPGPPATCTICSIWTWGLDMLNNNDLDALNGLDPIEDPTNFNTLKATDLDTFKVLVTTLETMDLNSLRY